MKKILFAVLFILIFSQVCFAFQNDKSDDEYILDTNVYKDTIKLYDFLYTEVDHIDNDEIFFRKFRNSDIRPQAVRDLIEGKIAWRGDLNNDNKNDYIVFLESSHDGYDTEALISTESNYFSNAGLIPSWTIKQYLQDKIPILCLVTGPSAVRSIFVTTCSCIKFNGDHFILLSRDLPSEEFSEELSCPRDF